MKQLAQTFYVDCYPSIEALAPVDQKLFSEAQKAIADAYAPYSEFSVGAAVYLDSGRIIRGSNQENAAFPAGLCAERVVLSAAASQFPGQVLNAIAVSYKSKNGPDDHPISPCGICRQTLVEYEGKQAGNIRVILGGQTGDIYVITSVAHLLPLGFNSKDLNSL